MNDNDPSLEARLRGMPLRAPSLNLDARVNDLFAPSRSRPHWRLRIYYPAIAAGLLIAAALGIRFFKAAPVVAPMAIVPVPHPIQIERDTSTEYDDGVITNTKEAAYRQIHRRTVREIWYVDPQTHARAQVTIPVEQVLIEKVENF